MKYIIGILTLLTTLAGHAQYKPNTMQFQRLASYKAGIYFSAATGKDSLSVPHLKHIDSLIRKVARDTALAHEGGGGSTTIYSGNGTLAGNRTVTGSNNSLTFDDIFAYRVNSDYNVISTANGSKAHTESISGAGNLYQIGYTPTVAIYGKGAGIYIDTNNNLGGAASVPTTAPLYSAGNSFYAQGIQSGAGNFYRVTSVTTDITANSSQHIFIIDASGGNIAITLPAASAVFGSNMGIHYKFKRVDGSGNSVTIQRAGSDTIDGGTSTTLTTQYQVKELIAQSTSTWGLY